jgi:hypothetical protein
MRFASFYSAQRKKQRLVTNIIFPQNSQNKPIINVNGKYVVKVSERSERAFLEDEYTRDEVCKIAADRHDGTSTTKLTHSN